MLESAVLAWVILAFASFYAAEPHRRPATFPNVAPAWSPTVLRVIGTLLFALSVTHWSKFEGVTAAMLVVPAMFCGVATLFVLLAPVAPRLVWGLAIACAPVGLALAILGGARG